ncbi:MAG: hypothetical protein U5K71_13165 [Gracilimonas sp.]|nr:hypothetical protein [Gracilimonas sp.]
MPGTIIGAVFGGEDAQLNAFDQNADPNIIEVTKDEMEVIENLRQRVTASLDEEIRGSYGRRADDQPQAGG